MSEQPLPHTPQRAGVRAVGVEGRPLIPRGCGLDPFPPGAASSAGRPPPRPAFGCGLSCLALAAVGPLAPVSPFTPSWGCLGSDGITVVASSFSVPRLPKGHCC